MSPTTTTTGQSKARVASKAKPGAAASAGEGAATLRTLTGTVVSNKMQKTIAVVVERLVKHPQYGKYVRRTTKLLAHDEGNTSKAGDLVSITECRPYSKRKAWRLVEVLRRAEDSGKPAV
ncbi:MAG: 30S ribosomal protein S17 [Chromatiales bacterium]|nr:30S ribosomal protein S17 [Chromatiales bacterium]